MRSIWKGSIAFGLVNVPVKVYSATEDHDIRFHQVHAKDNGRIRYKRVCEVCGEVVDYHDLARAFAADDGRIVVITDDDIATMPEERSREIEVLEFVPASDVDPMMFDRSYFLEPDSKSSKSYVLLAKTLAETDRMAIVHFTLRNKTRLAALRVKDFGKRDVMVVHTLLWPDEIRDPDFPVLDKKVEIKPAELKMAGQVVESMADDFNPDRYHDTYQEQLRELIDAKLEGGEAFITEEQPAELDETEDVSDLLAKLEASVKARSGNGRSSATKAPAEKSAAEKKPTGTRGAKARSKS
ncbi:non-homologous end joining protein Ku [Mycobacterium lacus]|nr:Ku protein [Mycobacterium lacus]MCV7124143.1 Ku protein [Mycobacterium lacus]ORW06561.1 Ku protein [Mycobacterium lacus]